MPRNSSGVYTLASASFVPQTTVSSTAVNADYSDIATAITQSLATTGVSTMTGAFVAAVGAVATPSYVVSGNTGTGWYLISVGIWGFAVAQNNKFSLGVNGLIMTPGAGANFVDRSGNNIFGMPIGAMSEYGAAVAPWTAPKGWLYAYGQAVSRTTYSALFTSLGTLYGAGDGATTFNLPDTRGCVIAGKDDMGGTAAGRLNNAAVNGIIGTTLGAVGGIQAITILQANMPSANASHTLSITLSNNSTLVNGVDEIAYTSGGSPVLGTNTSPTFALVIGGTISSGGSGTLGNMVQPTIIVAKMIYSGV